MLAQEVLVTLTEASTPIRQRIMHFMLTDALGPISGESSGHRAAKSPLITISGTK
jgi:hypothetical protein